MLNVACHRVRWAKMPHEKRTHVLIDFDKVVETAPILSERGTYDEAGEGNLSNRNSP